MLKRVFLLLFAIWVFGMFFGEDEEARPTSPLATAPNVNWIAPDKAANVAPASPNSAPSISVLTDRTKKTLLDDRPIQARLPSRTAEPNPNRDRVFVTGNRVNLRAGPGTSNRVLGQLFKGQAATVLERKGGWARIRFDQAVGLPDGWMSTDYLSEKQPIRRPALAVATTPKIDLSRARRDMIRASIAAYSGNCPCPYNRDRAGRRCGKRSAYTRPGGASPLCFEHDITDQRARTYAARQR